MADSTTQDLRIALSEIAKAMDSLCYAAPENVQVHFDRIDRALKSVDMSLRRTDDG